MSGEYGEDNPSEYDKGSANGSSVGAGLMKSLAAKRSKERSKPSKSSKAGSRKSKQRSSPSVPGPTMGLDLSLTATGLVVWDGSKVLRHRRFKTEPAARSDGLKPRPRGQLAPDRYAGTEEERIEWLRRKVKANVRKFGPCLVAIESKNFVPKGSAKKVDELQGVIKNLLHRMEIPFVPVAPTTLKKKATGDGRADKMTMIVAAKKFCREISDDDRADALHLARLAWMEYDDLVE